MRHTKTLLTIGPATADDAEAIVEFNRAMARETEGRELEVEVLRRGVLAALAGRESTRYFVARLGSLVIGQVMVTSEWSDWRNGTFWWLQSVYVHAEHRRQAAGTSPAARPRRANASTTRSSSSARCVAM